MNALTSLINDALIQQIGWTLVHSLWQGVVFAALLAVILRAMRTAPATMRYIAACAAMGLMVFAVVTTFYVLTPLETVTPPQPIAVRVLTPELPAATALPVAPRIILAAPSDSRDAILRSLVAAWLVGVGLMSAWHIVGWMWLQRLRRGGRLEAMEPVLRGLSQRIGIKRMVRIVQSTRVDVPAVVGALRPMILVPLGILNDLPAAQIEAILAHELAHVRRHDYFVNLIQAVIESVTFYHPATWWISAQIRIERENCCDDIAAAVCGDRRTYAAALAAVEERRGSAAMHLAPAANGGMLIDRVRRLLRLPPARPQAGRLRSLAAAVVTLMCIGLPVAVVAQNETPSPVSPTTKPAATAPDVSTSPIRPDDLQVTVEDHRMSAGDMLSVAIVDLVGPGVETTNKMRVTEKGMINLPLIGAIQAAGMTTAQAEKAAKDAYRNGNLMPNAQVTIQVEKSVGKTFSIIGQVDRPGQYQITQPDLRVLDALALAGGRPASIDGLRIIRQQGEHRVIEIPVAKLVAGEVQVNVVIRPGDMLVAASAEKQAIRVIIAKDKMRVDGAEMDIAGLTQRVEAMSESQRRSTFIEAAAASPDVTVERFFSVTSQLFDLVNKFHLSHLSQTGIERSARPATTQAAAPVGMYYVEGNVRRPGAYSFSGREITLMQAIIAAGGLEESAGDSYVQVERRSGKETEVVLPPMDAKAILSGSTAKFWMKPDYVVMVKPAPVTIDQRKTDDRIAEIATLDPTMRKYIEQLDEMEMNLAKLSRNFGPQHVTILNAKKDIELQRQKIESFAKTWTAASRSAAP